MRLWSQAVGLVLAVAAFAVSLCPRRYDDRYSADGRRFRVVPGRRLLRFPGFWLGAAFLCYVGCQGLNPAWRWVQDGDFRWLAPLPHAAWLPHGMDTPFAEAGPGRALMVYGSAWLVSCALWIGATRRRTLRLLLVVLAVNAFALAALGIAERALGADKIFWSWTPPASYFVASFTYKNHAGAYFDLMLGVCAAAAVWFHEDSGRRLRKSDPAGLFALFALFVAIIVVFSYSRAATVLMLAYAAAVLAIFLARTAGAARRDRRGFALIAVMAAILGVACLVCLRSLPTDRAVGRMNALIASYRSATPSGRHLATLATLDMFRASPVYGWGAGSFRYIFPVFQRAYPSITMYQGALLHWEHAHDDYAEMLAELGLVGVLPLIALGGYFLARLIGLRFWKNSLSLCLAGGCALTLLHCAVDFNFYNPAILVTWTALVTSLLRWNELRGAAPAR